MPCRAASGRAWQIGRACTAVTFVHIGCRTYIGRSEPSNLGQPFDREVVDPGWAQHAAASHAANACAAMSSARSSRPAAWGGEENPLDVCFDRPWLRWITRFSVVAAGPATRGRCPLCGSHLRRSRARARSYRPRSLSCPACSARHARAAAQNRRDSADFAARR